MAKGKAAAAAAAAARGSSKSKQPPAAGPSSSSTTALHTKWPPFKPPLPVTNLSLEAPVSAFADKILVARNFFPKSLCRDYVAYLGTRTCPPSVPVGGTCILCLCLLRECCSAPGHHSRSPQTRRGAAGECKQPSVSVIALRVPGPVLCTPVPLRVPSRCHPGAHPVRIHVDSGYPQDRYQVDDNHFARRLWLETGLKDLVSDASVKHLWLAGPFFSRPRPLFQRNGGVPHGGGGGHLRRSRAF